MNKEEFVNLNMKSVMLDRWKSKLSYPFNLKDLEELENIIDYYEGENQKLKEEINKISKKELKIMQMLRSMELCTLTKERINQIEEVMFEIGDSNE